MYIKTGRILSSLLLVAVLAALPAGCKRANGQKTDLPLAGVRWILYEIRFSPLDTVQIDAPFSLFFHDEGKVDLVVDCNVCSGYYLVGEQNALVFTGEMACTEAYCGDDSLDKAFLEALARVSRFLVKGDNLSIYFNDGTGILNFIAEASR